MEGLNSLKIISLNCNHFVTIFHQYLTFEKLISIIIKIGIRVVNIKEGIYLSIGKLTINLVIKKGTFMV